MIKLVGLGSFDIWGSHLNNVRLFCGCEKRNYQDGISPCQKRYDSKISANLPRKAFVIIFSANECMLNLT